MATLKGLTTQEAFSLLLFDPEVYANLSPAQKSTIRSHRKRAKEDGISVEKMEKILEENGYKVIQEKLWRTP